MRKKLFPAILMAMAAGGATAENLLQVVPQPIVAGSTSADGRAFTLQMNNDEVFTAFQFDIYLPAGVDLDDFAPVVLSPERFPNRPGRPNPVYTHVIDARKHDGFWRVIVYSTQNEPINGNSGDLLYLYYVSEKTLPDEPMPLRITNVVMAISGTEDVKPADCSSYLYTSGFNAATANRLDLSGLTGYVPHDVIEITNTLTEGNTSLTEIDISGADDTGADLTAANPNCLRYIKEGSQLAGRMATETNVVTVGGNGNSCAEYILSDGYPASVSKAFTAAHASYRRTVPAAGWYSLCLPFAASATEEVTVERYSSMDTSAGTITFAPGNIEANMPCIFSTTATNVELTATDASVAVTPEQPADAALTGTYRKVGTGAIEGCYALYADGSGFGRAGQSAYAEPFRAYISTDSKAKAIRLIHSGATSVGGTERQGLRVLPGHGQLYLAAGTEPCEINIHTIDGRTAGHIALKAGQEHTMSLESGIYIINNTKITIK